MSDYEPVHWETFVVRLWRETGNSAWRGQIVHMASRESTYFASLAQAEAFISRFVEGIEKQTDSLNKEETDVESNSQEE